MIDRTRQTNMVVDHGMTPGHRASTSRATTRVAPTMARGGGKSSIVGAVPGARPVNGCFAHLSPRRIAVFRALYLGDLLLAVPALRSIRSAFPEAEITLIGLPWAASFARRFSRYIDRFVEFVGYPGIHEVDADPESTQRFLEEQRAYGYDLVIQMHGNGRVSDQFVLALNGQVTVGYYESVPPAGLTVGMPYPEHEPEVQRNLGLAELLGCRNLDAKLEFPLFNEDRGEAARLLRRFPRANRPWIGLHAGAKLPVRRWPVEYFARVADHFAQRFNAQIILTGSPVEESTVRALAERMESYPGSSHTTQPLSVVGQTSLGGLAALISELDLFISNDTGPAHIANAVDTPSVTIFGPADPRRWAALDQSRHPIVWQPVACSPCEHRECPIDHRCLRWISPERVIEVGEELLLKGAIACNA
ncbi:MAG: glycosyltransferase family 9 protein [Ktedonobacteraceae bacterium]